MSAAKHRAWFADQYLHPHESKHTIGEVLEWFDEAGLEFVRGVPSITGRDENIEDGMLFQKTDTASATQQFLVQLKQVAAGSREGGFFYHDCAATRSGSSEDAPGWL